MNVEITGTLTKVLGRSKDPDSDWLVAMLRTKKKDTGKLQMIKVKGVLPDATVGLKYTLVGEFKTHEVYGEEFAFTCHSVALPTERQAIIDYLVDNCEGVGQERAMQLCETFGDDEVLEVMRNNPGKVSATIRGITIDMAKEIAERLTEISQLSEVSIELNRLLKGANFYKRISSELTKLYGSGAVDALKENPYEALSHCRGVGFESADQIALRVGIKRDAEIRIKAAIKYVLQDLAPSKGHTAMRRPRLLQVTSRLISLDEELVAVELEDLIINGRGSNEEVVTQVDKLISTKAYYYKEREIASWVAKLLEEKPTCYPDDIDYGELEEDQEEAFLLARDRNIVVITGAPGTGKTYTVKKIVEMYAGSKLALCAPTGKAAKRLAEVTGFAASTVHRLLEPRPDGKKGVFKFTRNEDRPIEAGVIVVDEASMLDVNLMHALIRSVSPGSRLILVGDTYQLPAVGPGNVLKDIIESETVPCVELSKIKRQKEGSLIVRHCHSIKDGKSFDARAKGSDYYFFEVRSAPDVRDRIVRLVSKQIPDKLPDLDPMLDVQVLGALRERSDLSVDNLNEELKKAINPAKDGQTIKFSIGDKVIQTKNDYDKDVINGDIGFIRGIIGTNGVYLSEHLKPATDLPVFPNWAVTTKAPALKLPSNRGPAYIVEFFDPPRMVQLPVKANNLSLAYAITVHKFQGSEAPICLIPIHPCLGLNVPQRNWLYTAMSRAKTKCLLLGDPDQVAKIIDQCDQKKRVTRLKKMLQTACGLHENRERGPFTRSVDDGEGA